MTQDNILLDKTIDFAIRMAKCYKYLMEVKNEYINDNFIDHKHYRFNAIDLLVSEEIKNELTR